MEGTLYQNFWWSSGPAEGVRNFVAQLKEEGVFAKEIATAGKAYHSPMMEGAAPALKAALQKVIMCGFILNLLCNSNSGKF